jgi:hypothetical protein
VQAHKSAAEAVDTIRNLLITKNFGMLIDAAQFKAYLLISAQDVKN